ncbi:archease [Candidatus Micrarchaeota archaeon]|nr:archease [Candidatus Micrarchaeota archaeon]
MKEKNNNIEFLEHTADILFRAKGKTFEEALETAALAMFQTIARGVKKEKQVEFEEKAETLEELVCFALSRALTESEINEIFFAEMNVKEFSEEKGEFRIKAVCTGGEGKQNLVVKAVTFHQMKIERKEKETTIQVLLDV